MSFPADSDALRRRLSRWLLGGSAALLLALLVMGLAAGAGGLSARRPAPAFDLPLLTGGRITNADLDGRVAVINIWASWCPPCREEAPALRRVYDASDPDRVVFLGVAHNDTPDAARGFIEDFDVRYANAIEDGAFGRAFGVRGIPMTFVLDADGLIASTHFGPISESKLTALIDDALAREDSSQTVSPRGGS